MRAPVVAALLACLALAQAACGGKTAGAAGYTCGYMRDTVGAFRAQARVLVAEEGLRAQRLTREEAVLDAELEIRRACDGAADADRPYNRAARRSSRGWLSPGSVR
jgi:hypothetical protein